MGSEKNDFMAEECSFIVKVVGLCSNKVVSIFVAMIFSPVTIYHPIFTYSTFHIIQVLEYFYIHDFKEY